MEQKNSLFQQLIESHIAYPSNNQFKNENQAEISRLIKTTHDHRLSEHGQSNNTGGAIDIFTIIAQ